MTRPCYYTKECPHQRDIEVRGSRAVQHCIEVSLVPLAPRTPARLATRNPNDGMPEEMASDRMHMSPEVLREHYNVQSEEDKRNLQRRFLNNL